MCFAHGFLHGICHCFKALYAKAVKIKWGSKESLLGISLSEWEPFILSERCWELLEIYMPSVASCPSQMQVPGKWYCTYCLVCVRKGDIDSNQLTQWVNTLCKHCDQANLTRPRYGTEAFRAAHRYPLRLCMGGVLIKEGWELTDWVESQRPTCARVIIPPF